jgi:hypothetical protein
MLILHDHCHAMRYVSPSNVHQNHNVVMFSSNDDGVDSLSASEVESNATNDGVEAKLHVPDPPRFLARGYIIAAVLNAMTSLALVWNYPNSALDAARIISTTASTATTLTRHQPNLLATYTAGALGYLLLAGCSCQILADAVNTKRLYTSETYKRLTLGVLLFGLIGLWSLPGEVGCNSRFGAGVMSTLLLSQITKFITSFVSFVGWEYSAGGFNNRVKNVLIEIVKGCRHVVESCPVSEERPASFYRTFFLLVTVLNPICNIPELAFNLSQGARLFSLPVSLNISSIARLSLLSVLLCILKDGAERDRLDGSTFIKLNVCVGLWAFGVGIAQGFGIGDFNIRRAADKLLFAALFLNNGVVSQLRKMGFVRKEDPNDPDVDPPLRVSLF